MQILQEQKHQSLFYDHIYKTIIELLSVGETFENSFTDLCRPTPLVWYRYLQVSLTDLSFYYA